MNGAPLLPGATIGVLGGGQLARMQALEARRMGYRVAVLDPNSAGPAAQLADHVVQAELDSLEGALELAKASDVITLDTEHIPAEILSEVERHIPVRPSARVLGVVQDRLSQRQFLRSLGAPQPTNAEVSDLDSLHAAAAQTGYPCVIKTRRSGYDGKGQARAHAPGQLVAAWDQIGRQPAVLEAFVDFEREVSVVLARSLQGDVAFYPLVENTHLRHILHTSLAPARLPAQLASEAQQLATTIAQGLEHVGVMAVELFVTRDQRLLVNELAPRTHNSGHYTFGACATSQFAQHTRAICGLPLGDPALLRAAVMLNLLGELWARGAPDFSSVLSRRDCHLHLYGKDHAPPGRKMGHVLVLDAEPERALATATALHASLARAAGLASDPTASTGS